jgi:hypothetical protein
LQYGIVTNVSENKPKEDAGNNPDGEGAGGAGSGGGQLSGAYGYIINGKSGRSSVNGAVLNAKKGPAAFVFKNGQLDSIRALEKLNKVTLYEAGYVLDGAGNRYLLAGGVNIYQMSGGEYKLLSLKQALTLKLTFTAYYDKPESDGGRIRILLADQP